MAVQEVPVSRWNPEVSQEKIDSQYAIKDDEQANFDDTKVGETIEDSPYENVRAAVRPEDNGEVANTVRAWILGMIFVTIGSGLNMFLSMRNPAISFPALVIQLIVYPIGCLWAKVVPKRVFNTFGVKWTFNTGPFTIKEHAVITLMSNVSIGYAYSTDALLALIAKPLYNMPLSWGFQLLFTLSSQLIGITLAGLGRRFLIWPAAMTWPGQFSNTSLFYALHDKRPTNPEASNGWSISRYRYFLYVSIGAFAWYWVPGVIWQGLSVFAFITWIKPKSVIVNQLFGGYSGLSLLPISFDWTYVNAYLGDPLLAPVSSHVNTLIGLVGFMVIIVVGIIYNGALYADYLPVNTSRTFDNTGAAYNVTRILGPGYTFNHTAYEQYSPMFLAPTFALNYGLSFAALTASLVHVFLYHRKEIWHQLRQARNQIPDIHLKLMLKYPDTPDWWYLVLLIVSLGLGLATILGYDSQTPWWAFFVAVIIAVVFVVPTCVIMAFTNIGLALNIISPFLGGLMLPGKPIAVMIFKVYSTITLGQAQAYASDLKMAHYMKVPPRTTFSCQLVASIWACFVQIAVMNWTLGNIPGVCEANQPSKFTCPNGSTFFSSSIVWGVIGPKRMFGVGSLYANFEWFWFIGAALPVVFYTCSRIWPKSFIRHLNAPVMLGALGFLPPATPLSFFLWAFWGIIFNYCIRRRWGGWWNCYNYVTAAALDAGLVVSTIIVFFAIILPGVQIPQWWGNTAPYETLDSLGTAVRKTVPEGGTFGPTSW